MPAEVMEACGVNTGELRDAVRHYLDTELEALKVDGRHRSLADQRLPARRPARHPPRPVLGPRRGDRRQRAGRAVLRARELCRLFPAAAGHEPPRRGQLYQPRRRQGRGGRRSRAETKGGEEAKQEEGKKKPESALKQFTVNLNEKAEDGRVDPLIGRGPEVDRTDPDPLPPLEEQPALCRRSRRRQDRDRRRPRAQDRRGRRARRAASPRSSIRSTWARCSPAPAIAAISRSG